MKIEITKATKDFPRFSDLQIGDTFIYVKDKVRTYVCMKTVMPVNGKIKAVRLADGIIFDIERDIPVMPCKATLNVEVEEP